MATWRELSEVALTSAESLLREGDYRGSISRSYYAAYYAATSENAMKITSFSNGNRNPEHAKLSDYVLSHLSIPHVQRRNIANVVRILRMFREDADYRPHAIVDEQLARNCVRDARAVQHELW